jgi:L-2-hydroxyglutarate oxidase LhgO
MERIDVTVVGAGVVGLAVAARLSGRVESLLVLERHRSYGQETSSRNSEVVHAGIYYPQGSLKALLCVQGRELLYDHCRRLDIPHRKLGKLIVARDAGELPRLEEIRRSASANGVDLDLLDAAELSRLEPAVRGVGALLSEETGILDSHALMRSLHHQAEAAGALFSFGQEVNHLAPTAEGWEVGVAGEDTRFLSRVVVNAAGLSSDRVASLAGIDPDGVGYRLRYCKGSYFAYAGASPVSRLVYPVPHHDLAGLGVHATLDLGGRLRFGPDTEDVLEIDYRVDPARGDAFFQSAASLIAGLSRESLTPDMAGIRPKLAGEGVRDFVIRHEADRGLPGLVNLVGIESPGLTACLAIALRVENLVAEIGR